MKTFSVKDFERSQHYKDRSPPWIKLYNELLDDFAFGSLSDAAKWHLVAIGLLASRTENKMPYDAPWIGRRINALEPVDLDTLVRLGFIVVNQELHNPEQVASGPLAECLSREETEEEESKAEEEEEGETESRTLDDEFSAWYEIYPLKKSRGRALKAYRVARKKVAADTLLAGAQRYRDDPGRKSDFTAHPASWLNDERWLDEATPPPRSRTMQALDDFETRRAEWRGVIMDVIRPELDQSHREDDYEGSFGDER